MRMENILSTERAEGTEKTDPAKQNPGLNPGLSLERPRRIRDQCADLTQAFAVAAAARLVRFTNECSVSLGLAPFETQ